MGNFEKCFVNNVFFSNDKFNNEMVKISEEGYDYKRIDNREEIKDNKYKTNLYVDSA